MSTPSTKPTKTVVQRLLVHINPSVDISLLIQKLCNTISVSPGFNDFYWGKTIEDPSKCEILCRESSLSISPALLPHLHRNPNERMEIPLTSYSMGLQISTRRISLQPPPRKIRLFDMENVHPNPKMPLPPLTKLVPSPLRTNRRNAFILPAALFPAHQHIHRRDRFHPFPERLFGYFGCKDIPIW